MEKAEITINDKAIERLKRKIILQENQNLKTREKSDQQMVAWIKKQIVHRFRSGERREECHHYHW